MVNSGRHIKAFNEATAKYANNTHTILSTLRYWEETFHGINVICSSDSLAVPTRPRVSSLTMCSLCFFCCFCLLSSFSDFELGAIFDFCQLFGFAPSPAREAHRLALLSPRTVLIGQQCCQSNKRGRVLFTFYEYDR